MANYKELGASVGSLITEKQKAYGDSFHKSGKVLEQLFPNGIPNHCYVDALAIVRIVDKLFRIATDPDWGGESPWKDVAGYALLRLADKEARVKTDNIMDRIYPDRMPNHSWEITQKKGNWSVKDRGEDDGS
jgi:hypothetical protein